MFEISITTRLLQGLRNTMLEAVTDLIYGDATETDQQARQILNYMGDVIHDSRSTHGLDRDTSRFLLVPVQDGYWLLQATRDILGILVGAVIHARNSLLEFEIPIRIKLTVPELIDLRRMLEDPPSSIG